MKLTITATSDRTDVHKALDDLTEKAKEAGFTTSSFTFEDDDQAPRYADWRERVRSRDASMTG